MNPIRFLKQFVKWANSRTLEQKMWWLAFLAVSAVASYLLPPFGLFCYLVIITCMVVAVWRFKGVITAVIILSLALSLVPTRCPAQPAKPKVVECNAIIRIATSSRIVSR
jgi:hypothetical protein